MSAACPTCGAPEQGSLLCAYCGTPTRELASEADQAHALDEFHVRLVNAESDKRSVILENGWLPSHPRVLVDAGLRMLPTLENAVAQSEAAGRLLAIITKLRLNSEDEINRRAADELKVHLERYYRSDRIMGYWVLGFLALTIGGLVWWFSD